MSSFTDVSKQIHLLNDLIMSEMLRGNKGIDDESVKFSKHLLIIKYWFMRISWVNKKRFMLTLLKDVTSVWTLSLLLKSIWSSRPKDAVSSISEFKNIWSSYDQVPLDNNRTATPLREIDDVIERERHWFTTLESEHQAIVFCELLTVAGGPILWEVLREASKIYHAHRDRELEDIVDCVPVVPSGTSPLDKAKSPPAEPPKKEPHKGLTGDSLKQTQLVDAQKELETHLATWNVVIKSMKDNIKLEEIQIKFNDGAMRNVWRVNRPKPEATETVDFIQLLLGTVGKRILTLIPSTQYGELSRVNKYWAFLIDELKSEILARQKIDMDLAKLKDMVLRHEPNTTVGSPTPPNTVSISFSTKHSVKTITAPIREKKHFVKMPKEKMVPVFSIRRMADLHEKLDARGSADDDLWKWCGNTIRLYKKMTGKSAKSKHEEGLLPLKSLIFACPLMKYNVTVPLEQPLVVDPTVTMCKENIRVEAVKALKDKNIKRYNWWCKDLAKLYLAQKIPSYQALF
ncbi:uncharacterized protein LOC126979126 isoform X2 [Leptidea sinapis]|uniref:uncharacterized protein LOC126979126 isoform X2 n=1 Tax=Leptidea sinapis TaxID=189913 RepID=UPI00212563D4|nr:uncharacterized protein LOC126979126 isoform X2 [Leptidea sinapis]